MGRQEAPAQLFYDLDLEQHVLANHMLREIDLFLNGDALREALRPFYSLRISRNLGSDFTRSRSRVSRHLGQNTVVSQPRCARLTPNQTENPPNYPKMPSQQHPSDRSARPTRTGR